MSSQLSTTSRWPVGEPVRDGAEGQAVQGVPPRVDRQVQWVGSDGLREVDVGGVAHHHVGRAEGTLSDTTSARTARICQVSAGCRDLADVPSSKSTIQVTRHPMALSFDAERDRLLVCEFGAVPERKLPDYALPIGKDLRFFLRRPAGTVIGFEVRGLHRIDVDAELPSLWTGPRFRVPVLGLKSAVVAAIVLRARVVLAGCSTPDVLALGRADECFAADDHAGAEVALREALTAGNLLGHLRLAGCLAARGRYSEAYDHARMFTELAPRNSWGWANLGRICVELGDCAEATAALRRAVRLERQGSYETFAARMLASLKSGSDEIPF